MSSSTATSSLDQGGDVYGNIGGSNASATNWTLIAIIAGIALVVAVIFWRKK